jgi:hypothetical protein
MVLYCCRSALQPVTGLSGSQRLGSRQEGGAEEHGVLQAGSPEVRDVLAVAGVDRLFTVSDSLKDALPRF